MPDTDTLRSLLARVEAAGVDDDHRDIDRDLYALLAPMPLGDSVKQNLRGISQTFGEARRPGLRLTSWMFASELPVWLGLDFDLAEAMRHERAATPGLQAVAALLRFLIERDETSK